MQASPQAGSAQDMQDLVRNFTASRGMTTHDESFDSSAMRRDDSSMHSSGTFLSLESLARLEPSLDQKSKSDYTGIFSDRDG